MSDKILFEWEGREHDNSPKSADWYWVLGIIATASAIATVLFGNYLLTVLIIVATATIAIHSTKSPPIHQFRIVEQGLVIGEELHPFEKMISFSMLEDINEKLPPLLSIKNESWISPHLVIPLDGVNANAVYEHFLRKVNEGEHSHTFVDLVAVWLGF